MISNNKGKAVEEEVVVRWEKLGESFYLIALVRSATESQCILN